MADAFDDRAVGYGDVQDAGPRERSLGEHVFIWCAWAVAAAFWGASLTIFGGILHAVSQPTAGLQWLLIGAIGGLAVLGLALAHGSYASARRDSSLDAVTGAGTAELYDQIEHENALREATKSSELGLTPAPRR